MTIRFTTSTGIITFTKVIGITKSIFKSDSFHVTTIDGDSRWVKNVKSFQTL